MKFNNIKFNQTLIVFIYFSAILHHYIQNGELTYIIGANFKDS